MLMISVIIKFVIALIEGFVYIDISSATTAMNKAYYY